MGGERHLLPQFSMDLDTILYKCAWGYPAGHHTTGFLNFRIFPKWPPILQIFYMSVNTGYASNEHRMCVFGLLMKHRMCVVTEN
jgi:hypothetical protein